MTETILSDGIGYLMSQSGASLLALFWFTALFELPRYTLSFIAASVSLIWKEKPPDACGTKPKVSVVVAGYNEEDAVERCVLSLHEQSSPPDEIIVVSDGSYDRMPDRLRELQDSGLITQAHCLETRGGKAAGFNLASRFTTGDIIINVDCDCSYDRHAIKRILEPFADPAVGSVSGNILVRNQKVSLVATFQAIEYLISISLGKQAAALTDHVVCVSGAFGAFRREAFAEVGGVDVGGGEDLDGTIRMRKAGWAVRFASGAICYTDVPASFAALVRQRFRWERDAVRLRYRKHANLMNPFSGQFKIKELVHEVDFIIFNVLSAAALPFYILWLLITYGNLAPVILLAAQAGLTVLDTFAFILAAISTPRLRTLPLLPYVFGFGLFNGVVMRFMRLAAYLEEWLFIGSSSDPYVPEKVLLMRRW